ncbi:hypothetical protein Lfu02_29970 [Longispora fulva]|uniref:Glyoxylase-like metal-dependent hydrolase (Beta-lactamase superfamily II) n=1 Tax=Longispora fulva TaxID=619741 RepID=A0A8J7GLS5_9ACTN|nr:MBL fold metallo-hydrolase [Longispora fulva]MBG6139133.1 glyoxylase-like metal-dependent hydrolase (beta-lactamase superfamily II) [Longispora fulva]GIG58625.1 hypothetical protein Lfu02_29970 [Longispora fulva]
MSAKTESLIDLRDPRPVAGDLDVRGPRPVPGDLDVRWIHGAPGEPPLQAHHYAEHTVILRQGKAVNYEAPFLYLLFGEERALLLDTGATEDPAAFPLRATVDRLVAEWLERHPRAGYQLVVAHTHGHHDHVAADPQFADRPDTTVVPRDAEAVRAFFGFEEWPNGTATLDLGGRVLEILGTPGHHEASITVYDPWTGILLTGDTVLPGRVFVFDPAGFRASLDRLLAFAEHRTVTHVLGCHVELTTRRGRLYPIGAGYQPRERALAMTLGQVAALRDAAAAITGKRGVFRHPDFVIYQEPQRRHLVGLLVRGRAYQLRARLGWR